MTFGQAGDDSPERTFASTGPYSARVRFDRELGSTVVLLAYEDRQHPASSITIEIAPDLGSNLFRFRIGTHEIIHCAPELLKQRGFTGNFVLWPFPNRMREKRYTYQGQAYSLEALERPEVLIHGLVYDRQWQYALPMVGPDAVSITTFVEMTPESPHYAAYPFESRLSLTYTLTHQGVRVAYLVENRGAQMLPYGFGLHPYFSLLSGRAHTLVSLPASAVMEADDALLPTGRLLPVDGIMYAMFDLRQPTPVGNLRLDHVYTALGLDEHAEIFYQTEGLLLRIAASQDFTHAVIFTPAGRPYFCLEQQTCSTDAINLQQRGLQEMAHLLEVPPGAASGGFVDYLVEYQQAGEFIG